MRRDTVVAYNLYLVWSFFTTLSVLSQEVGPRVKSTRGEVWPKPAVQNSHDDFLKLEPENFDFNVVKGYSCDILQSAFKRYNGLLFSKVKKTVKKPKIVVSGILEELNVNMLNPCEDYPTLEMDEKYEIKINNSSGYLLASSIWGVLRGLETFSQLVTLDMDGSTFVIRCTSITDYPRFRHRGYLLDTSRHYFPMEIILLTLDAMSYSKLNVFHWHIVDDNSFPYQSSAFPNLSKKGAFGHSAIYTRNDVKLVIEYAKFRGIRVIPEFDTPGHTLSWGLGGIPGLLTECSSGCDGTKRFGPVDPTREENYDFIGTLLNEINELFEDRYLHVGGDEVEISVECWASNEKIQQFMKRNKINNTVELEKYYFKNIFNITRNLKTTPIVWQEVFDINTQLDPDVVVQIWKGENFNVTVHKVLESGHPVVVSSGFYLDYLATYGSDWKKMYGLDPSKTMVKGDAQNDLLLGGEASMWGEFVDETNVLSRSWPRASAVAELLWSHVTNATEAGSRLEEHVCRMKRRGVPAEPANGPSYCDY